MNPLTNVRKTAQMNDLELRLGTAWDSGKSWHQKYKDSAWIFVGGLPYDLTEGDVIAIFSQYGEIVNINLIRDRKTGKSKGFGFICYEDQKSTVLAVDNFNGTKVLNRILRVDHVEEYRVPTIKGDEDEEIREIWEHGCAPKEVEIPEVFEEDDGLMPIEDEQISKSESPKEKKKKQHKKHKKEKKSKKKKEKQGRESSDSLVDSRVQKATTETGTKMKDRTGDRRRESPERNLKSDKYANSGEKYEDKRRHEYDRRDMEGPPSKRDGPPPRKDGPPSRRDGPPPPKRRIDDGYVPSRYR